MAEHAVAGRDEDLAFHRLPPCEASPTARPDDIERRHPTSGATLQITFPQGAAAKQGLRVFPALPHSARLVWPHFLRMPVDVPSALVLGGLIKVTLAHALIADQKRRRESAT